MIINKHNRLFTTAAMLGVAAFSVLAFASCQKDDDNLVDLTAVIADKPASGAKVTIDNERYACWSNGDVVSINGNEYTVAITNDGSTHVTISGVTYNSDGYAAVYPASCHKTENAGSTSAKIILPDAQEWDEDHIVTPMVAYTTSGGSGSTLLFQNPCNLLKVTVTNGLTGDNNLDIHQIIVTSSNTILTGEATVTGLDTTPSISSVTGGTKDVTLDCGDQTIAAGDHYTFYVTVPKVSGEQFRFRVLAKNGGTKYTFDQESQEGITLTQNEMVPISITLGSGNANGDNNFWGSGTRSDPFLITDSTDLSHFIGQTSGWFRQTANIENYGSYSNSNATPFTGHYDGGGHFIRFKLSETGLFKTLGNGAEIKNLTLKGDSVTTSAARWGAFCCEISNSATVTLKNCTNEISCTSTGKNGLGGLIGYVDNALIFLTLEDCTNNANISGKYYAGGLLGAAVKVGDLTMTRCSNKGAVTCVSAITAKVGGFVSYVSLNNSGNKIDLDSCVNSGTVALTGTTAASMGACGGIIGYLNEKNSTTATITNCANKADVSAGGTIQGIGGIVGILVAPTSGTCCTCNIFNSYSTRNLSVSGTMGDKTGMGGIMAILKSSTMYTIVINNCYFSGSLSVTGTGGITNSNYSGIVSKKDASINCTKCYSTYTDRGGAAANGNILEATTIPNSDTLNNNRVSLTEWSSWKDKAGATPVFSWEK